MLHRKEQQEKDKKLIFAKEIVAKNQLFTIQQIEQFYELFQLYVDPRFKKADLRDIVSTAKTLALDNKYRLIYDSLLSICSQLDNQTLLDFQTFIRLLTQKLGHPYDEEGRKSIFSLIDQRGREQLDFSDIQRISQHFKYNLSDNDIREVISNVEGTGSRLITWDKFNKYVQKKLDKRKL